MTNFQSLPPEIQLKIFSYLNNDELHSLASFVCKKWRVLAKDPILKRIIDINGDKQRSEEIIAILKSCFLVKNLSFFRVFNWEWINDVTNNYVLKDINLVGCFIDGFVMENLVNRFANVENVTLICCQNGGGDVVVEEFTKWKFLKRITIQNCEDFIENGGKWLEVISERCLKLENLVMEDSLNIYDSSFLSLTRLRGPQLKQLVVNCDELTSNSYKSLDSCRNLIELRLNNVDKMADEGLMALKNLDKLEILQLTNGESLSISGFVNLFEKSNFEKMRSLCLWNCPNFDNAALIKITKQCQNLTNFTISYSDYVTDYGLYALVRLCRNLTKISLTGLHRTTGLSLLYSSTTLSTVEITDCSKVTDDFLQILSIFNQNLSISTNGEFVKPQKITNKSTKN